MHHPADRLGQLLHELKRRRVVRVALGYAGAAFVLLEGLQLVVDVLELPQQPLRVLVLAAIAGFPVAVILSWTFDLSREGIRLTGADAAADRLVVRVRRRTLLTGVVALLVVGAATLGVLLLRAPRSAAAGVAFGAETIAVLPFSVSGDAVRDLEQGMVDLLSRNLNELGPIRTVDPRAVLIHWRDRARDGTVSLEDALDLARTVGAGSVLTGSVVAAGGGVRIGADLHGIDGLRIASVQVDGRSADVLALVDSLAVALLREIWRSRQPLPQLSLSAVTTGDLDAIRAFLAGERHYRAAVWDSALAAFGRAVAADSTFALAHYRIAATLSWFSGSELGDASVAAALRQIERLPQREQTLLRAEALRRAGRLAEAIDTLSAFLDRRPDDPEAWFYLADDLFHLRHEGAAPGEPIDGGQFWMFDRALALDPGFTPALIHPLEVGFARGDTTLVLRYLEMLNGTGSFDREAGQIYGLALQAIRAPDDANALDSALRATMVEPRGVLHNLGGNAAYSVRQPLLRIAAGMPPEERRQLTTSLLEAHPTPGRQALQVLVPLLVMDSALGDARAMLERASVQREAYAATIREIGLATVLAGHADSTFFVAAGDAPALASQRLAARMFSAVDRRDARALRAALADSMLIRDAEYRRTVIESARGMLSVLQGDTAGGLARIGAALEQRGFVGGGTEAMWFRWLELRATYEPERARALEVLEQPWPGNALYEHRRLALLAGLRERNRRAAAGVAG